MQLLGAIGAGSSLVTWRSIHGVALGTTARVDSCGIRQNRVPSLAPSKLTFSQPSNPGVSKLQPVSQIRSKVSSSMAHELRMVFTSIHICNRYHLACKA